MKKICVLLFCGLFLFSCASNTSSVKNENQTLDETKAAAEDAVKRLHDLQVEKAKLEAEKTGK